MTSVPSPGQGARATTRELLARHGLSAKKSWGQNFLLDRGVQQRIVAAAAASERDVVVEIGAGLGALTGSLAEIARKVIAIERDPDLVAVLREEFSASPAIEVVALDALDFDFGKARAEAEGPLVIVGNLPYQITSPLVFRIGEAAVRGQVIARAVLMVQKEFAERMVAKAGSKIYGRLSVMVQQWATVEILFHVGSGAFHPPPAVASSVLRLTPLPTPRSSTRDPILFAQVVKAAFGTRRKMLRRALEPAFGRTGTDQALAAAGIEATRRAEELSVADFARLADAFDEQRGPSTSGRDA